MSSDTWSVSVNPEGFKTDSNRSKTGEKLTHVKFERYKTKKEKVILRPPNPFKRMFENPNAVRDRYFTAAKGVNEKNMRDVHAEPSPFKYPVDMEEFSYRVMSRAWRDVKKRQKIKLAYNEHHSYRTKQQADLLNRLWVKDPTVKSMKTILDLDDQFFSLVEGRPVPEKIDHKQYIEDIRTILRTKIVNGYRTDEILLIDEKFRMEQSTINQINREFQRYVNTFEEFLFVDHTNSMALLRKSEEQAHKSAKKYEEFRELSKNYGNLKSIVYNLEEKWRNCKMYQKFLYLVSPMDWRRINDFYHKSKRSSVDGTSLIEEKSGIDVFGRYKLTDAGEVLSLGSLIDQFLDDIAVQEAPTLYFTEPPQLLKVFYFIEMQNLYSLLHLEELAIPLEQVRENMESIVHKFERDVNTLQDLISSLEVGIIWEEERATTLEDLARALLNGEFKDLTSSDEVVNLHVFVEDAYESRIGPNDSNLTMNDMMLMIEIEHRRLLLQLDRLPSEIVHKAETECYTEEAKTMAAAVEAAKTVVQVERLMNRMAKLLEPPVYRIHQDLKFRSPPHETAKKPPSPPKPLTDEEIEYLTMFVDFCHHTDDPSDFGVRVHKTKKAKEVSENDAVNDE